MTHRLIAFVAIILTIGVGCSHQNRQADVALKEALESKRLICAHLDIVGSETTKKLWYKECLSVGVDLL